MNELQPTDQEREMKKKILHILSTVMKPHDAADRLLDVFVSNTEMLREVKAEYPLSWQDYFMNIAHSVATKSKDPSTKVGCVITDAENGPVSFGFNGFVAKSKESVMTYARPMKYLTILHAEENAILFAKRDLRGCTLYCTHYPCNGCLRLILQSGIRTIYYHDDSLTKRFSKEQMEAINRLLQSTDVTIKKC